MYDATEEMMVNVVILLRLAILTAPPPAGD